MHPYSLEKIITALIKPPKARSQIHLKSLLTLIKKTPFFQSLDDSLSYQQYKDCCMSLTYLKKQTGDCIIRYGDRANQFFILIKGKISILVPKDIEWEEVAKLQDGACFGDYGLNEKKPRLASVVCLEQCHLAVLDRISYQRLLQKILQVKQREKIQLLRKHALFASLSNSFLLKLVYFFHQVHTRYGKILFQEQEKTDLVYLVKQGEFKIFRWMQSQSIQGIQPEKKVLLPKKKKKFQVQIAIATTGTLLGEDDIESQTYSYNCMCTSKEGVLLAIKIRELQQRVIRTSSYGLLENIRIRRNQRQSQYQKKVQIRNLYQNQQLTPIKLKSKEVKKKFSPPKRHSSRPKLKRKVKEKLNTNINRKWSDCVLKQYRKYSSNSPSLIENISFVDKRTHTPQITRSSSNNLQSRRSYVNLFRHF